LVVCEAFAGVVGVVLLAGVVGVVLLVGVVGEELVARPAFSAFLAACLELRTACLYVCSGLACLLALSLFNSPL
jgi:hypothetical protein